MKPTPTDLEILDAIYNRYYDDFAAFSEENKTRHSKVYVPIDIIEISKGLNVDEDIVFGRLYYHLENKYGYTDDKGVMTQFFAVRSGGGDRHCVNFPYLGSILADLRDEDVKYRVATTIAVVSFIISIISFLISIFS